MADISECIEAIQSANQGNQIRIPISDAFAEIQKNGKSVVTLNGKPDTYYAKQSDMASVYPMDQVPTKRSPRLILSGSVWAYIGDVSEYKMAHPEGTENPSEEGWYEIITAYEYLAIDNPGSNTNPSAKGWYEYYEGSYILTSDTKTKTETFSEVTPHYDSYEEVTPEEGDNPKANGWYELVDETYILTEDEEADPEKTYYEFIEGDNPFEKGWYELVDSVNMTYSTTGDTKAIEGKTYYEDVITEKTYYEKKTYEGCLYILTEDISVVANKTYYEKLINIDWRDD